MNRRIILGILLALVLVAGAVAVGAYAYNAGVAQGLVQSGQLVAPEGGTVPYPYYGGPFFWHRPFGFGFGFLGCLFPLLFFFLFFGLLRGLFWGRWGGGQRGWGSHGPWGGEHSRGVPPMFEEWHKQAHGEGAPPTPDTPDATGQ